jgi:hypothetical protein
LHGAWSKARRQLLSDLADTPLASIHIPEGRRIV